MTDPIQGSSGLRQTDSRFGLAARVLAILVGLCLAVITTSAIAISAFSDLQSSFDNVMRNQIRSLEDASELRQRAESLAGMAPALFASGLNREAMLKYSMAAIRAIEVAIPTGEADEPVGWRHSASEQREGHVLRKFG